MELFYKHHIAPTSVTPLGIKISGANGSYLIDENGKNYIDLVAGFSTINIGHNHPAIINAIKTQSEQYSHVMVYGDFLLQPQIDLATLLTSLLPKNLNTVYFTNSGTEAVEGALKLAKRIQNRSEIITFHNAYHGSTQGALSIMGNEFYKNSYRPLLPDIKILEFNNIEQLKAITNKTACVIIEPVQGEAGIKEANHEFLSALKDQCNKTNTLLIFDEVQTGFGRTGKLFAFETYNIIPDILVIGKAFGGGMPLAAFISSTENMKALTHNPPLGHITTFGGHPICCAAGLASLKILLNENIISRVENKATLFKKNLQHNHIKEIRNAGLLIAVELFDETKIKYLIRKSLEKGVLTDGFLLNNTSFRITPPLTITDEEIKTSCTILNEVLNSI